MKECISNCNIFEYEIGENCYIYFHDDYESCIILDRMIKGNFNYYLTDVHPNWQNESFLRKINTNNL